MTWERGGGGGGQPGRAARPEPRAEAPWQQLSGAAWSPPGPCLSRPQDSLQSKHGPGRELGTFSPVKRSIPNMVKRHRWTASSSPTLGARAALSAQGSGTADPAARELPAPGPLPPWKLPPTRSPAQWKLFSRRNSAAPGARPGAWESGIQGPQGLWEGKGRFHHRGPDGGGSAP